MDYGRPMNDGRYHKEDKLLCIKRVKKQNILVNDAMLSHHASWFTSSEAFRRLDERQTLVTENN